MLRPQKSSTKLALSIARKEERSEPPPSACDERERVALASRLALGRSAAPAILAWASACMIRATAAATSKFATWASSMSLVSSPDPKARHQSSGGGDAGDNFGAAR